jgi:hypothetical protein
MIEITGKRIPEDHPIRALFHTLTERGFEQMKLRDEDTIEYISNMLTDFVDVKNLTRGKDESGRQLDKVCEFLQQAGEAMSPEVRRDYYRHIGDITLFNLGLYPESLTYGRHTVSPDFYAEQGRRSYHIAAAIDTSRATVVFRKLSEQFEQCVVGLNWVKLYINDPFYQYVFREFGVT